jgi:hypothetical protein
MVCLNPKSTAKAMIPTATPIAMLAVPIRETVAEKEPASLCRMRLAMNEGNCKGTEPVKFVFSKNKKKSSGLGAFWVMMDLEG